MQVPFLDLSAIHEPIRQRMDAVYDQVMRESYYVYGRQVIEFEKAFAEKCDVAHCIALGNCTDALYVALKMMGIGPGDEVLVPALTWITDAETVNQTGANPVFIDVDEGGLIDISQIESKISVHTKAIIPVHLYGRMCDMPALMNIAEKHGLKTVEDCAQSHLASWNGRTAGSYGHASVFSFYPTKNLGALGDAGCILTNDGELAVACRKFANHGASDKHNHEFPGINSRMDTLQAAVLLLKMEYIDDWTRERQRLALRYSTMLKGVGDLELPMVDAVESHVFHIYAITTGQRDRLKEFLKTQGIQTQIHYPKALPFTSAYSDMNHEPSDFPAAYDLQQKTLSLPLFPGMSKEQQEYVVAKVKTFF